MKPLVTRLVIVAGLLMGGFAPSIAEEQGGLKGFLSELLRDGTPGIGKTDTTAKAQVVQATETMAKRVPFGRQEMQLSFAPLVSATAPAVVNVYASAQVRQRVSPFMNDPFFEQFFGGQRQQPRVQSSLGSGVIVGADGLVVTNFHVIKGADEVKVALSDGREFESKVLLKDESVDLAVLKIEAGQALPFLEFGDSDGLEVGDLVLAIGNPFGVGQTTTSGIVSALARSHIGVTDFGFFIQTDAAINPGNSGGALIDMAGRLIGINTAIFSRSGGSNGIGFAIPSIMVKAVVNAARNGGDYFERPFFGATLDRVTPQIAEALGMERPSGVLVVDVTKDAPAAKGGLKAGDVLLSLNGRAIEHPDALGYRLATLAAGDKVAFDVLRAGSQVKVTVALTRAPAEQPGSGPVTIQGNSPFAGSRVQDITPRLAQRLRLAENAKGAVIAEISAGSPAEQFGFRAGDIVRELNGSEVKTAAQLNELANENTRWWRFSVERDGRLLRQVLRY